MENSDELGAFIATPAQHKWLSDSGAGVHIVGKQLLGSEAKIVYKSSRTIRLNTANGKVDCNECVWLRIPSLDRNIEAVVVPKGPRALSLGRLVEDGFELEWKDGTSPPTRKTRMDRK